MVSLSPLRSFFGGFLPTGADRLFAGVALVGLVVLRRGYRLLLAGGRSSSDVRLLLSLLLLHEVQVGYMAHFILARPVSVVVMISAGCRDGARLVGRNAVVEEPVVHGRHVLEVVAHLAGVGGVGRRGDGVVELTHVEGAGKMVQLVVCRRRVGHFFCALNRSIFEQHGPGANVERLREPRVFNVARSMAAT